MPSLLTSLSTAYRAHNTPLSTIPRRSPGTTEPARRGQPSTRFPRLHPAPDLHAVVPGFVDAPERHRPKRELPGLPFGMTVIDVALVPRRPDPDPKPGKTGVPNGVLDIPSFELADSRASVSFIFLAMAQSLPQDRRDGIDRLTGRCIGEVSVFERGPRMIVPQQPAYGQHGFAMHEGDAGVGVPEIVRTDIGHDRLPSRTSCQKSVISD